MTNKVLAEGNPVLGFLMDPDCPFERVDEDTAMAPFYFFKEDWVTALNGLPSTHSLPSPRSSRSTWRRSRVARAASKSSTPNAKYVRHCGVIAKSARTSVFAARTNRLSSREAGEAGEAGYPAVCKP